MNQLRNKRSFWQRIHIDLPLLTALLLMMVGSLAVVYSASGQNMDMMTRHATRMLGAIIALVVMAQVSPNTLKRLVIPLYFVGLITLIGVFFFGVTINGAKRWLDIGITRFQPSEIMKIAVPMMVAWYIGRQQLPPKILHLIIGFAIVIVPTVLIQKQPDLGTSLLIASSGVFVLFLSGLSWKLIGSGILLAIPGAFAMWHFVMHEYQKQRVLTLLDPESDPLGAGYHIIQSKIAIGSGGIEGKGWLQGTQSQLEFLPERHTDFIFSVLSEEFGLLGVVMLLSVYLFIIGRGLYIAVNAQEAFSKLLAGALTLTFFVYIFVNIGMVSGLLPVVGVPLPLVSYGGTSMVTLMAGFGIIMAIATDKRMLLK
ncbi:cell wall shape-determining protein [Pseudoalteromonas luteoviolacea S2607]|uniref:rod shape-determining protein RodA n=1 Tax=Pseudoalteromonas luteoviolacea TaxID=43657 RepID=UPI0007B04302|nr:rod shape-determining protein RodA [Pseudoalteromonas luteoviolacea]KZN38917.1 cell wall shape-determining protein [Pseudoalteromonas luteoviolacea S2607]